MTMNLEVPSPLRAGLEVTAVCSGTDIHGSAALTWYLNGVQIADGFTTTSEISRSDDWCTFSDYRSDNAVNESVTSGLDYRINRFTYYNVSSELTFTPTTSDNGGVLQCRLIGSERSRTLDVQHAPADNIILIKIVDEDGQETDGLRITCHVHPRDQPFPPIENYEIAVNDVIESSSSSPSLILESIPSECFEISCTGVNDIGMTNASKTYCPRSDGQAPPARNILSIEIQEINGEGSQVILVITCHISPEDQSSLHLHTYTIGVDNTTLSSSSSASALFRPRPHNRCINVTCSGTNGIGWTSTSLGHCSTFGSKRGSGPGVLQRSSTTYVLLVTAFFMSMMTYAIVTENINWNRGRIFTVAFLSTKTVSPLTDVTVEECQFIDS
ncbi:uncharacterized protein [Diadema antillarum]|uniref:uncharacterized protein n=1 Tax=Diadema antillarum TaxID=105358 RepID=UPI003A83B978